MSDFFPGFDDEASTTELPEPPESIPRTAEHLLVETIRRVGVSNYSLIARLTGLNSETVRYKVNKQLSKMGLGIQVNLDYANLGFSMCILSVKGKYHRAKTWLDYASYLIFVGKLVGSDRYLCVYALPHRFKKKYIDELVSLRESGLVEQFESQDVSWVRNPPFRSEFFNFDECQWNVDWQRVDTISKEMGLTTLFPGSQDAKIDSIDVRILLAMQEDPTVNPAKIAKQIEANARTIRYHYLEHIIKGKLILGNNVRWIKPMLEGRQGELMKVVVSFKELLNEEVSQVQKICNKIPFTWQEARTASRSYFAFLDIPVANFHDTVHYLESKTELLQKKMELMILDSMRSQAMNIPHEMFDEERGWRLLPFQKKLEATALEAQVPPEQFSTA